MTTEREMRQHFRAPVPLQSSSEPQKIFKPEWMCDMMKKMKQESKFSSEQYYFLERRGSDVMRTIQFQVYENEQRTKSRRHNFLAASTQSRSQLFHNFNGTRSLHDIFSTSKCAQSLVDDATTNKHLMRVPTHSGDSWGGTKEIIDFLCLFTLINRVAETLSTLYSVHTWTNYCICCSHWCYCPYKKKWISEVETHQTI